MTRIFCISMLPRQSRDEVEFSIGKQHVPILHFQEICLGAFAAERARSTPTNSCSMPYGLFSKIYPVGSIRARRSVCCFVPLAMIIGMVGSIPFIALTAPLP